VVGGPRRWLRPRAGVLVDESKSLTWGKGASERSIAGATSSLAIPLVHLQSRPYTEGEAVALKQHPAI
jgi:hypothetical protein